MELTELFAGEMQDIQISFDERIEKFRVSILYENGNLDLILNPFDFTIFMDKIMSYSIYVELISHLEDDVLNFYRIYSAIVSAIDYLISPTEIRTKIKNDKLVKVLEDLIQSFISSKFGEQSSIIWDLIRTEDIVIFKIESMEN